MPTKVTLKSAARILHYALAESLNLQSHYARLLNGYDGGSRLTFDSPQQWIDRLVETSPHNPKNNGIPR